MCRTAGTASPPRRVVAATARSAKSPRPRTRTRKRAAGTRCLTWTTGPSCCRQAAGQSRRLRSGARASEWRGSRGPARAQMSDARRTAAESCQAAGAAETGPLPRRASSITVAPAAPPRRRPVGPAASRPARAARCPRGPRVGSYSSEPATQSLAALARLGGQPSGPAARPAAAPRPIMVSDRARDRRQARGQRLPSARRAASTRQPDRGRPSPRSLPLLRPRSRSRMAYQAARTAGRRSADESLVPGDQYLRQPLLSHPPLPRRPERPAHGPAAAVGRDAQAEARRSAGAGPAVPSGPAGIAATRPGRQSVRQLCQRAAAGLPGRRPGRTRTCRPTAATPAGSRPTAAGTQRAGERLPAGPGYSRQPPRATVTTVTANGTRIRPHTGSITAAGSGGDGYTGVDYQSLSYQGALPAGAGPGRLRAAGPARPDSTTSAATAHLTRSTARTGTRATRLRAWRPLADAYCPGE